MWKKDKVYFFQPREGIFDSNTIIVDDEKVLVVDPGTESRRYFEEILEETGNSLEDVDIVFNTHGHYDHFQGDGYFPNAEIMVFKEDADKIVQETGSSVTRIEEERTLDLGESRFEVIHTPGHSKGSCSLYLPGELLICGDLVFANGSYGRTDLSGGCLGEIESSLKKIKELDFRFLLPGHRGVGNKTSVEKALRFIQKINK